MRRLQYSLAITATLGYGVLFYTFSVVLGPMRDELGWESVVLSSGLSLGLVTAGICAPAIGRAIDTRGARTVMAAGSVVGCFGVALWAVATSVAVYLVAWVVVGAGMAMTLYEPAFAAITRHAPDFRRQGVLVVTLLGGFASTLFIPLTEILNRAIGWRGSLAALAFGYAALTLPLHLWGIPRAGRVLHADAGGPSRVPKLDRSIQSSSVPAASPLLSRSAAVERLEGSAPTITSSPRLRRVILALVLGRSSGVAVGAHLVAFLIVSGRSPAAAAGLAAGLGAAKFGGRMAVGVAARQVSAWWLLMASFGVQALGLVLPLMALPPSLDIVMVALYGAGAGATTVATPLYIGEQFGLQSFGLTSGRTQRVTRLSDAAAPAMVGGVVTLTGRYTIAWAVLAVSCAAAAVVLPRMQKTTQEISPN